MIAIAPSGCFERERFVAGLARLERAGLRVRYQDGVYARHRYLAGDDSRRTAELAAALADPEAKALWIARGGYGAARLLPAIAPERVSALPRWLVGFSDATVLHALWARAGLVSLHGPNVTTLPAWSDEARSELFELLAAPAERTYAGRTLRDGPPARGRLLGGNLTVLASLAGTGALPSFEGAILLLEDVDERPYRLDRSLTQLRLAGSLRGIRAVVIGQLTGCEAPQSDIGAHDVLVDALAGLDVPIVSDLPFGHEPSARAVLLGTSAELDPRDATLRVVP